MKKIGAFILLIFVTLIILTLAVLWRGLMKLPSSFEIKQSIVAPVPVAAEEELLKVKKKELPEFPQSKEHNYHKLAESAQRASFEVERRTDFLKDLMQTLMDSRQPLSDVCRDLETAGRSGFLREDSLSSANSFLLGLTSEKKDPLIETAAPVLRYIFRAPGVQFLADSVLKSEGGREQDFFSKAEFYYEMLRVGDFLRSHTAELDRVLQKSYNLHYLARAVASRPEIAREPAVKSFCEDMEKNLNLDDPYDADVASAKMLDFFSELGIEPKSLGYDPSYRSKVKIQISRDRLGINDTWLLQLFSTQEAGESRGLSL